MTTCETVTLGDVEVTILVDGVYSAPVSHLAHTGGEAATEAALAGWNKPTIDVDVNCFLLRSPEGLTLIDAGAGFAWGDRYGKARTLLAELGVRPADIGRVILTHLHGDHALGLLDGESAWLPNAEIVVPDADWRFFGDADEVAKLPDGRRGGAAIAAKLAAAYERRIRTALPGETFANAELLPLPGHTPGQAGYVLRGPDATLLICADLLHEPALQAKDPDLGVIYDILPTVAAATRRDTLARCADEKWIIAGGHLKGFGRVRHEGQGFVIEPLFDGEL